MVRSDVSQIDARLESRVHAIMTSALGEERVAARQPEAVEAVEAAGAAPGQGKP
jgi:hypothetical protein